MPPSGICLPHAQPQGQTIIQSRMREIKVPAAVEAVHQGLIGSIPALVPEAHQIQGHRRGHLEAVVTLDPPRKLLCQLDVPPNLMLQPFHAVVPDDEPELQRPEAPPQRNLPVAIVNHGPGFGGLVAQIFRQHAQSLDEHLAVGHIKAIAVEIGEHPFVGD